MREGVVGPKYTISSIVLGLHFLYFVQLDCQGEIIAKRLTPIWKERGVTLETKVKLVNVWVFPIVLY